MKIFTDQSSLGFLLVEDDTVAAIELECILEDMGHHIVAVAVAPKAAKKALMQRGGEIDAVIFGARLVGLPAFSLAQSLSCAGCPAIVSSDQPESVVRALGFDEPYLAKPFLALDVAHVVSDLECRPALGAA